MSKHKSENTYAKRESENVLDNGWRVGQQWRSWQSMRTQHQPKRERQSKNQTEIVISQSVAQEFFVYAHRSKYHIFPVPKRKFQRAKHKYIRLRVFYYRRTTCTSSWFPLIVTFIYFRFRFLSSLIFAFWHFFFLFS